MKVRIMNTGIKPCFWLKDDNENSTWTVIEEDRFVEIASGLRNEDILGEVPKEYLERIEARRKKIEPDRKVSEKKTVVKKKASSKEKAAKEEDRRVRINSSLIVKLRYVCSELEMRGEERRTVSGLIQEIIEDYLVENFPGMSKKFK